MTTTEVHNRTTDYDDLIPPAISEREVETRDLTTAFFQGFNEFLHANNYKSDDLDRIFEEVETFVDIERLLKTENGEKSKKVKLAHHMIKILENNPESHGMEFNAFFDARLKYIFSRTKITQPSTTIITQMRQLLSNLFKS